MYCSSEHHSTMFSVTLQASHQLSRFGSHVCVSYGKVHINACVEACIRNHPEGIGIMSVQLRAL